MSKTEPATAIRLNELIEQGIALLQHDIAIRLAIVGVTQSDIARDLHLSKSTVNKMLRGLSQAKKSV
jgi:predicted transcriptional regulator